MFYAYKIANINYCKIDLELDSLNVTKKFKPFQWAPMKGFKFYDK